MESGLIGSNSLYLFISVFFVLLLLAFEGGYRFGRWRKSVQLQEAKVAEPMVAGIFGLLTFVLVFTFNIASNRYGDRKMNVVNDANAITTAFLRADLVSDPQRSAIKKALIAYTEILANLEKYDDQQALRNRLKTMQLRMWKALAGLSAKGHTPLNSALATALNTAFEIHSKRVYASIYNRFSDRVWYIITVISVLSFLMLGIRAGFSDNKSYITLLPFVLAISVMVYLIGDLDIPQAGIFKVSQQPMLDALSTIRSYDAISSLPPGR